jgi:hypothetical protein
VRSSADDSPGEIADADLQVLFTSLAETSLPRAPLNAALSRAIAADPDLYRLMRHAPPTQRNPVLLLACLHASLLDDPAHPLVEWYPNLTPGPRPADDPALASVLGGFVAERTPAIIAMLRTRSTQTNEVGRSAMFLVAFGVLADEVGPLGHLDVGTSAGLNLLLDRFAYRFHPRDDASELTAVGPPSPAVLTVSTEGRPPIPATIPTIAARSGIDRRPIDVTDDDEARWLEACVWPDQTDRFERLRAAIDLARDRPPQILAGDAVDTLERGVQAVGGPGHPVITNSWVLNYFTSDQRRAYLTELDRIGTARDLSWVWFESPQLTPELPAPDTELADASQTVLSLARWRGGRRTVEHLAVCHPHGYWLHWR